MIVVGRSDAVTAAGKPLGETLHLRLEIGRLRLGTWMHQAPALVKNPGHVGRIDPSQDRRNGVDEDGLAAGNHQDAILPDKKARFTEQVGVHAVGGHVADNGRTACCHHMCPATVAVVAQGRIGAAKNDFQLFFRSFKEIGHFPAQHTVIIPFQRCRAVATGRPARRTRATIAGASDRKKGLTNTSSPSREQT